MEKNERRHERFQCELSVWIHLEDQIEDFILAEVLNISAGGFLCIVHTPVEEGTHWDFSIEIPQRDKMVKVRGVTRHCRAEDEHYLIGLEFTDVEDMSVATFMSYIEAMFL